MHDICAPEYVAGRELAWPGFAYSSDADDGHNRLKNRFVFRESYDQSGPLKYLRRKGGKTEKEPARLPTNNNKCSLLSLSHSLTTLWIGMG